MFLEGRGWRVFRMWGMVVPAIVDDVGNVLHENRERLKAFHIIEVS